MFVFIRNFLRMMIKPVRWFFLNSVIGIDIHPSSIVSLGAFIDKTKPQLVHIGKYTIITRGAVILSHDFTNGHALPTYIGDCCFIGVNAVVLPGVKIGNSVVVGAGSVVTADIPANSMVIGNPARVLRPIKTGKYGKIIDSKKK